MRNLTSIEGLTLLVAVLTLGATLYFGLFPRPAHTPKLDENIAYHDGKPAIRVLKSLSSSDVSGALRFHLFYKHDPAHPVRQGDILTFRGAMITVTEVNPASINGDNDPRHFVALCRVVGGE